MQVTVRSLSTSEFARRACQFTLHSHKASNISLHDLYKCEHSPIRTQMFWIEMFDIPSYVSTHLVRHKIGVEHYVQTNREDRGADEVANRHTPVHHAMLINAQALIHMARKRLCSGASEQTQTLMFRIREVMLKIDPVLAPFLVPDCEYRNGCHEFKPCGRYE